MKTHIIMAYVMGAALMTMPLFVQAIASPTGDHVYLVAGAGIKL